MLNVKNNNIKINNNISHVYKTKKILCKIDIYIYNNVIEKIYGISSTRN